MQFHEGRGTVGRRKISPRKKKDLGKVPGERGVGWSMKGRRGMNSEIPLA